MLSIDKENRVGFKILDHKLELIRPIFIKNRELSEKEKLKEKIRYFNLLSKYKKVSSSVKKSNLKSIEAKKEEEYIYSIFEAYYLLLLDYIDLGPFLFTDTITSIKNKGRLNWNRTFSKSNLLISDNNFLYLNPLYTYTKVAYNHPITIIYGYYLLEIEKFLGINLNIHREYRSLIEKNIKNINIGIILNSFRNKMYSDRERKVIKLLYIINDREKKWGKVSSNSELYFLENMNNLWEFILKDVLNDQYYQFSGKLPEGEYKLILEENTSSTKSGLRMIPDIIKEYNGKLYIIDAKNYLPHINNSMPGSSDINKQILYRYFLSKEFDESNKYYLRQIKNIFLLPNDLEGELIRKIGNHRIGKDDKELAQIEIYQVDFDTLVNAYIDKDKSIEDKLLKFIDLSI